MGNWIQSFLSSVSQLPIVVSLIGLTGVLAGLVSQRRVALINERTAFQGSLLADVTSLRADLGQTDLRLDAVVAKLQEAQMATLTCIRERNELALELRETRVALEKTTAANTRRITRLEHDANGGG